MCVGCRYVTACSSSTIGSCVRQPTAANNTWRSMSLGRDVVEIFTTDPNYCSPTPCSYYIGVTGFARNASFSVLAEIIQNSTIRLADGSPVVSSVGQGSTQEYELLVVPGTPTVEVCCRGGGSVCVCVERCVYVARCVPPP
jgi:hypothetical protein